jgi:sugar lactone lactonase YvrE
VAEPWEVVADNLAFPEGLRWHDGRLWFSDIFAEEVHSLRPGEPSNLVATVTGRPSGLGWRPDGTLLAVNMTERSVVAVEDGSTRTIADLRHLTRGACNDMVVDDIGRAYVGHFGYDYVSRQKRAAASIVAVAPDGSASVAAEDVWFPNGMVLDHQGRLLVAETSAGRITSFAVGSDGSLGDRQVFADLHGARPDGMCLDAEGALWVASPGTSELLRVAADGAIVLREPAPATMILTVMLGGDDGRVLFAATSPTHDGAAAISRRQGQILSRRVDVAHAGLP